MGLDTLFFVGRGTLSTINAGLAESKSRGHVVWFPVSLATGPVGMLFIAALPRGT